jgi:hypothetical protein
MAKTKKRTKSVGIHAGRPDSEANISYWHASTLATISRHNTLRESWVVRAALESAWRQCVEFVLAFTAGWPGILASRLAAVRTEGERLALAHADQVHVDPPKPSRYVTPDEVQAALDGPPADVPWPQKWTQWIQKNAAAKGLGIEIWGEKTGWRPWSPADGMIPAPAPRPAPVLRPLLRALSAAARTAPAYEELRALLATPLPLPTPPAPTSSAQAREQYRRATALYKIALVSARRGDCVRRTEAIDIVLQATESAKHILWNQWPTAVFSSVCPLEPAAALAAATHVYAAAKRELESPRGLQGGR